MKGCIKSGKTPKPKKIPKVSKKPKTWKQS